MLRDQIHAHLAQLKLKGMLAAYDEIVPVGIKRRATPEKILHELLLAETAHREARSIRYRMGQARFPVSQGPGQLPVECPAPTGAPPEVPV